MTVDRKLLAGIIALQCVVIVVLIGSVFWLAREVRKAERSASYAGSAIDTIGATLDGIASGSTAVSCRRQ